MIRVVTHLRGQIERDRQPGLACGEQMAEPCVGLLRRAEPGVLPHGPELAAVRSEEHTSELQSQSNLVCRLLLEKKKKNEWNGADDETEDHPRPARRVYATARLLL